MTPSTVLGLLLQALAVAVVLRRLRRRWIHHLGGQFVIVAAIYHGGTELTQALLPGRNPYRSTLSQPLLDDWMLLVGFALLIFAGTYSVSRHPTAGGDEEARPLVPARLVVSVTVPMYAYALVNGGFVTQQGQQSITQGLIRAFLTMLLGVSGYAVASRVQAEMRIFVVLSVGMAAALLGQRWLVIAEMLLVLGLLRRDGKSVPLGPDRLQRVARAVCALAVALVAIGAISATRAEIGRAGFTRSSAAERPAALLNGAATLATARGRGALLDDMVYRFDGNTFPALVLSGMRDGAQPVGLTTIINSFKLAVPSFIHDAKLERDLVERNEEAFFQERFYLDRRVDFLPTVFGILLGSFGTVGMVAAAAILGVAFASLDRWILARRSLPRFLIFVGFSVCVLLYEQGLETYPVNLRALVLLLVPLVLVRLLSGRTPRQTPGPVVELPRSVVRGCAEQ